MSVSSMLARRAQALFVSALATAAVQASAQAADAQTVLQTARDAVVVTGAALRRINVETKKACEDADAADEQLLKEGRSPSPLTQSLAKAARLTRELCVQWNSSQEQAQSQSEAARSLLRQIALESAGPSVVVASPRPGITPEPAQLRAVVEAAQGAQDKVDKARKALEGIYDRVDSATKAALTLTVETDNKLVKQSTSFQSLAAKARAAATAAQMAANRFLDRALTIKACLLTKSPICGSEHEVAYIEAVAAQSEMEAQLMESEKNRKELEDAAAEVEVAGTEDNPAKRLAALRFAKLLQKYPEAGAPFAQNGFTLLASNKETSATIKLGWDRLYAGGWREVTLLFSAPLTGSASSKVFNFADGLTGIPKVGLSYLLLDARPLLGTQTGLFSLSTGFRLGSETRSYYSAGPAFPKSASSVRVWPASVSVAAVGHDPSTRRAHVLRASWQHAFEDGPAKNRCPVDRTGDVLYVDCITGSFGAPEAKNEGVLSYQYRYQNERESFAASPSLTHNIRTRVTEFGLPIFLWHSEEAGKRSFNTGIRFDWISKGKESISGNTRNEWSFGIFVGAPFTLFGRAD